MFRLITFAVFGLFTASAWPQTCDQTRPFSTPEDNFYINEDGTVTELETGLTWMRCAVGQKWIKQQCIGVPKPFTWKQAMHVQNDSNGMRWRLPTLPELASIIERQCKNPRINLLLFPDTPKAAFWTANRKKDQNDVAYALDFANSGVLLMKPDKPLYVRLVMGRE